MNMSIGKNYDKTKKCLPFQGYEPRLPIAYKSVVIHTTNGQRGSSFHNEASYLQNAKGVGAHYLVGKQGQIEQILDLRWGAWHAGKVRDRKYNNQNSIGIEVHFTPAENYWTAEQEYALTWLVQSLFDKTPSMELVTHRYVAIPAGRKIDPSGFGNQAFDKWRTNLYKPWHVYTVKYVTNIRSTPGLGNNIIRKLPAYSTINAFKSEGEAVHGSSVWYSLTDGYVHESVIA